MKCVILQPSYIPWRGVFDQIQRADVFVFYDDVQYDKHGWRNRNQVKTANGKQWLTIPAIAHGAPSDHIPIRDIKIAWNTSWNEKHLKTLGFSYSKAPYFREYEPLLREFYARRDTFLADFTIEFTIAIARALGINSTRFLRSSELSVGGAKTDRVLAVLQGLGATHYISGPSAREYIQEDKFRELGIGLEYVTYDYPEYTQLHPPYDPAVSILDLLFMMGPNALSYIVRS